MIPYTTEMLQTHCACDFSWSPAQKFLLIDMRSMHTLPV